MNSRERILDAAIYLGKHEKSDGAKADAAALRELDQLTSELIKYLHGRCWAAGDIPCGDCPPCRLISRAMQAGYGEK